MIEKGATHLGGRPTTSSSPSGTVSGPATRQRKESSALLAQFHPLEEAPPPWASLSGPWSSSRRTARWPPPSSPQPTQAFSWRTTIHSHLHRPRGRSTVGSRPAALRARHRITVPGSCPSPEGGDRLRNLSIPSPERAAAESLENRCCRPFGAL